MATMKRLQKNGREIGTLYRAENGTARLETKDKRLQEFFNTGTEFLPPEKPPKKGIRGVLIPHPVKELPFDLVLLSFQTHGLIDAEKKKPGKKPDWKQPPPAKESAEKPSGAAKG